MAKQKFNPFLRKSFQEIYKPKITISETEPASANEGDIWLVIGTVVNKPTAANFAITTNEDVNYNFAVSDFSANYNDADNNAFTGIKIISLPNAGQLFINGVELTAGTIGQLINLANLANLQFRPAANAFGLPYATFEYQVYDGGLFSDTYAVTCNVSSVNDKPIAANFAITTNEDVNYNFAVSDFSAHYADADNDAFAGIKIISLPTAGKLFINGVELTAGTIGQLINLANIPNLQFRPAANAFGLPYASFGYQVYDGGLFSDTYAVTCNVNEVINETINVVDEVIYLVNGGGNGTARKTIYDNSIAASEAFYLSPITYGYTVFDSNIYRHLFTFDTLHIPANAVISAAKLLLMKDSNTYKQLAIYKANHEFNQSAANLFNDNFAVQLGISAADGAYNNFIPLEFPVTLNLVQIQSFIAANNKVKLGLKAIDEYSAQGQKLLNYQVIKLVLSYSYTA